MVTLAEKRGAGVTHPNHSKELVSKMKTILTVGPPTPLASRTKTYLEALLEVFRLAGG